MERHAAGSRPSRWACSSTSTAMSGIAAELARQRPFGAGAVEQEAAEHLGAGRGAGDLLDLGLAVDREQADAEREGARDVALLLDGVAEGDALGRGAGREHHLDLGDRGGVEAGAERRRAATAAPAPGSPSRRRTPGCPAAPWQRPGSCRARRRDRRRGRGHRPARHRGGGAETRGCARSWSRSFIQVQGAKPRARVRPSVEVRPPRLRANDRRQRLKCLAPSRALGTRCRRAALQPRCCLGLERENPFRTAGKRWTSLFGAGLWTANETKKARSVVALSRVPR